jgi:hypothetical protein
MEGSVMSNSAVLNVPAERANADFDIASMFSEREGERYALHSRYMNEMMVRLLRTIGYDVGFCSGWHKGHFRRIEGIGDEVGSLH